MYFIIIALTLCAAYVGLLIAEARCGARLFEEERAYVDRVARQTMLIARHVDLPAALSTATLRLARAAVHSGARELLRVVRAVERVLTRLVRHLRLHPEAGPQVLGESSRPFVRTLAEFKGELQTARAEASEVR